MAGSAFDRCTRSVTSELGVAVQSLILGRPIVAWAEAGVGAVATCPSSILLMDAGLR